MSFEIVEVLGSISFHNANIAIVDPILLIDCEQLIGEQTDNKTFYITDTTVGDWDCVTVESNAKDLISALNTNHYHKLNKLGEFWSDSAAVAVVNTKVHNIEDDYDNDKARTKLTNWSGTVYFLFVNDSTTGNSFMMIEGVPKKGSKHFATYDINSIDNE